MHENDSTLLLRATPELLEGWCGPVVVIGEPHPAAVLNRTEGLPWTVVVGGRLTGVAVGRIQLDLSRAECRDRVARVVAVACGTARNHNGGVVWLGMPGGFWHIFGGAQSTVFKGSRDRRVSGAHLIAPALATLDPNDDIRLPDGSRFVDALALRMVAEHVLKP